MVFGNLLPTFTIYHHSEHHPGHQGPDSPAKFRGGRGIGAPAGSRAAGGGGPWISAVFLEAGEEPLNGPDREM